MKKTTITNSDVLHVAQLSNLKPSKSQIIQYRQQLVSVLDYVSQIQKLDLDNTPETHQVTHLTNVFREDEIDTKRMMTQSQALSNSAHTHNGYFIVPALIDQE